MLLGLHATARHPSAHTSSQVQEDCITSLSSSSRRNCSSCSLHRHRQRSARSLASISSSLHVLLVHSICRSHLLLVVWLSEWPWCCCSTVPRGCRSRSSPCRLASIARNTPNSCCLPTRGATAGHRHEATRGRQQGSPHRWIQPTQKGTPHRHFCLQLCRLPLHSPNCRCLHPRQRVHHPSSASPTRPLCCRRARPTSVRVWRSLC